MTFPRSLRSLCAALLLAAFAMPEVAAATARRDAPSCPCRNHGCCTFAPGAACAKRPPTTSGSAVPGDRACGSALRAGCGCHHRGGAATPTLRDPVTATTGTSLAPPAAGDRLPSAQTHVARSPSPLPETPPPDRS